MERDLSVDLRSVYESFGGDYDTVLGRLVSAERIERYLKLFFEDTLMDTLIQGMETGDYESMFMSAHTMKGNTDTLGLTKLHESSLELTEALRAKDYSNIDRLFAAVKEDYSQAEQAVADAE